VQPEPFFDKEYMASEGTKSSKPEQVTTGIPAVEGEDLGAIQPGYEQYGRGKPHREVIQFKITHG
jgi:hypothetical protein